MKRLSSILVWTLLAATSGCAPAPLYGPDAQQTVVGGVSPRSQWTVTGAVKDSNFACDGKIETVAVGPNRAQGSVTIDLGKTCYFNFIVIDHGADQQAYPHRAEIATSTDGRNFSTQISGPGTRRVSNFLLRKAVLARYVRITAVKPGAKPWTLAEVYIR